MPASSTVGLILTGGGARAAYQVGVLQALAQIRREAGGGRGNPFPVICGTSAGAINAAALACCCDDFDGAIDAMAQVWSHFHADQVYRSDSFGVARSGANWLTMVSIGWIIARWRRARPRSLLDNSPLQGLLEAMVPFARLGGLMRGGHLRALAIGASSYTSGQHVTFYDAVEPIQPWTRSQRIALRAPLSVTHLLASSAIPFVFPAVSLELEGLPEYFGDGSMRQAAPISPAVHLGADRILVVGAGRMHEPPGRRVAANGYPTLAQIAGHAMSSIFLDALAVDIERLTRINRTLSLLPPQVRAQSHLRPIEVLVIAPSQRLDDLAAQHIECLPLAVRTLLRGVGVSGHGSQARGAALASYLLFEVPYTRALMALGVADTLERRDEVLSFFGWGGGDARRIEPAAAAAPAPAPAPALAS